MIKLKIQAQIVIPQFAVPKVLTGVILASVVASLKNCPLLRLIGNKIPHPTTVMTRNMFRHISRIRRKTAASRPINGIRSCSFVFKMGESQANMPFPIGGGACLSSAIFSFGAYTREL